jgi:hypothetical protein
MTRDEQNESLVRLAGWYGIILSDFASVIFDGKDFAAIFKATAWKDLLEQHHRKSKTHEPLPGGISYITATSQGLTHVGLPKERSANNSHTAVAQRLAISFFCLADQAKRTLLSTEEASTLLGVNVPNNVSFVATEYEGYHTILRIYLSTTDISQSVRQIESIIDDLKAVPALVPWLASNHLGVAALCETPDKVVALREALQKKMMAARVFVSLGPSPDTVAVALKKWRKKG